MRSVMANPVRTRRVELDLTQQELADKAGISSATVISAEQGRSLSPLVEGRLARALDCRVADLFSDEQETA